MKLAKTVLEATLTVARLACQSWGNVMANLTLKSNPQFRDSDENGGAKLDHRAAIRSRLGAE